MAKKRIRVRLEEPSVSDWGKLTEDERIAAMQGWPQVYRELHSKVQLRKFFYEWAEKNVDKKLMPALRAGAPLISYLHGSYARAINEGYVTEYYQDHLLNKVVPETIEYGKKVLAEKQITNPQPTGDVYKPSIQERVAEQTRWIIGEVEGEIDEFLENKCKKSKFDLYKFLQKRGVKGPHTRKIVDFYQTHYLPELKELVAGKDDELNEAYEFLSAPQKRKYLDFVRKLIDDAEAWGNVLKSKRKPRKTKSRSVHQKVSKVKYKERDDDYKIVSVSPENLVDATQVWIFNTKDRFLYKYVSESGFVVKGTTLYEYNEAESYKKKIRKPDSILPDVQSGGKVKLRKLMDTINAKKTKVTGRINKDMIILRVI